MLFKRPLIIQHYITKLISSALFLEKKEGGKKKKEKKRSQWHGEMCRIRRRWMSFDSLIERSLIWLLFVMGRLLCA